MSTIIIPMIVCMIISFLFEIKSKKSILFFIIFSLILVLGCFSTTYDLIKNSAFYQFPLDLPTRSELNVNEVSIVFRDERLPIYILIIAIASSFKSMNEAKRSAIFMSMFLVIDGALYMFYKRPGPPTIYFEFSFLLLIFSIASVEFSNILNTFYENK